DYDALQAAGGPSREALASMNARPGRYDSHLLDALASGLAHLEDRAVQTLPIDELTLGMVLTADVLSDSGIRLVPSGHEITPNLLERIRNFSSMPSGVREPISV